MPWTPPAERLQELQQLLCNDGAAELPRWCEAWGAEPRFATYFLSRLTLQKQLRLLQMMRDAALQSNVWHFNCAISGCQGAWLESFQLLRRMATSKVRSDSTTVNSLSAPWCQAMATSEVLAGQGLEVGVRSVTNLVGSMTSWRHAMAVVVEQGDSIAWTAAVQGKDFPWTVALRLLRWMPQARLRVDAVLLTAAGDASDAHPGAWRLQLWSWRRGTALLRRNRALAQLAHRGRWEAALSLARCSRRQDLLPDSFSSSSLLDALPNWRRACQVAQDAAARFVQADLIMHNSLLSCTPVWPRALQQLRYARDALSYGFVMAALANGCEQKTPMCNRQVEMPKGSIRG